MTEYSNLPNNTQAERAVLGACLLSSDCLGKVMEILKPEDFYNTENRITYEILLAMFNSDIKIDLVTFLEEAQRRGQHDRLGGQPFVAELMEDISVMGNVTYHADIVKNHSVRRNFIEAGNKISGLAMSNDVSVPKLIETAEKMILDTSLEKEKGSPVRLSEMTADCVDEMEKITNGEIKKTGFKTNFKDLDNIVTLQPGSLNIIAARPSMGKTALALNIAQFGGDTAKNAPVLIFSLEMSREQLLQRMFAAESGVSLTNIIRGDLNPYEMDSVKEAKKTLDERNIFINDVPELSTVDFRAKCRRFKAQHPDLALIAVDYIQLMNSGNKNQDNRAYEVAEISRVIKAVAVELNCPIIALSQLSRETERRNEKLPRLSDLRDSGAIEQDADTVILLYREDYYKEAEERQINTTQWSRADLRIAKNRNGRTGACSLIFEREYTKFTGYKEEN